MKQEKESKRGKQKFSRRDIPGWSSIQFPTPSLQSSTLLHFSLHVSLRTKIYFGRGICLSEVRFRSAFYRVKSLHIYNIQIVKYE